MSEYRKKIEGFVWPTGLRDWVKFLARDADGVWFGWEHLPDFDGSNWDEDAGRVCDCFVLELPTGTTPLLLCRDDYVTNAEAATPDVTAMEKALREISGVCDRIKEQVEYAENVIATWPEWKKGLLGRFAQPAIDTPRPFVDNHSVFCSGDHGKPVGDPGCCCLRMLKENHS